jgi:hypothetical protein
MRAFDAKVRSAFQTFEPDDARLLTELRVLLASHRELLSKETGSDGLGFCRALSDTVDLLLSTYLEASPHGKGLAILALGGYGRGELSPFSDIDLMVLYPRGAADRGLGPFRLGPLGPTSPSHESVWRGRLLAAGRDVVVASEHVVRVPMVLERD